jgi:hypothetical protein
MDKKTAIELLGGTPKKAAQALGYKSIQAVYVWPEVLPQSTADRVAGAVARLAKHKRRAKPTGTDSAQVQ